MSPLCFNWNILWTFFFSGIRASYTDIGLSFFNGNVFFYDFVEDLVYAIDLGFFFKYSIIDGLTFFIV